MLVGMFSLLSSKSSKPSSTLAVRPIFFWPSLQILILLKDQVNRLIDAKHHEQACKSLGRLQLPKDEHGFVLSRV